MRPVKRLEIIIDTLQLGRLTTALDDAGALGYTVLPNARGRGRRGYRGGDELTDALKNAYVLVVCAPDDLDALIAGVGPILERAGGLCLVTDAHRVDG